MAIEVTVNHLKKPDPNEVKSLMIHKDHDLIVFRTIMNDERTFRGLVLNAGKDTLYPVGALMISFKVIDFEPFVGEVTLKQH